MRNKLNYIISIILIIIPIVLFPIRVTANAIPSTKDNPDNIAVVIVIDTSGSMKSSDPDAMRGTAANLFIDLLNSDDYLGIITFNTKVTLVQPITKVMDQGNKTAMKKKLNSSITTDGDTNYEAALSEAANQLSKVDESISNKAILFITDGEPDPDSARTKEPGFMDKYMVKLWNTVDNLTADNYPVYSIGFSDGIRSDVLEQISSNTGGTFQILSDSNLLSSGYIYILEDLKNTDIIINEDTLTSSDSDNTQPALNHDFFIRKEGYRVGEKISITSYLTLGGNRLSQNSDLTIDSYQLVITNDDNSSESISFFDDGSKDHDDMVAKDGIWSNTITFSKEAVSEASFKVSGSLNGIPFELEKSIGSLQVYSPGSIEISLATENKSNTLTGIKGKILSIPVVIENKGNFSETIYFALSDEIGSFVQDRITLEPNEKKSTTIQILLNGLLDTNADQNIYDISLGFRAENKLTTFVSDNIKLKIEVNSNVDNILSKVTSILDIIKIPVIIITVILLFFVLLGKLFYFIVYRKNNVVNGVLSYQLISNNDSLEQDEKTYFLTGLNKNKMVISFDENNPNADYHITGTRYRYDMVITPDSKPVKLDFIAGWRALIQKPAQLNYILSTTMPGIIEKEGLIYTKINLKDNEKFETGGYVFWFSLPMELCAKNKNIGKNILEGKYEKSTNQK